MDEEQMLLDESLALFQKLQTAVIPGEYFTLIPDSVWKGQARQLIRQYVKQRTQVGPIDDEERQLVIERVCSCILSDIFKKARPGSADKNIERDGAELFYRRALKHMATERFADAERALSQAVKIDESFVEAWEALLEVLEHNGKDDLAKVVSSKLERLKGQ